jgi:hypothetical protein
LEDLSRDASHIFAESRGHNWSAMIMSLSWWSGRRGAVDR